MSDSESEEVIRNITYITKSGRSSKTRYTNMPDNMATTATAAADGNKLSISPADLGELLNRNSNTTVISGDSLPTFRGRKRACDPPFQETNTFKNHVHLLKSYINTLTNCTEQDKKMLLVRSADKKLGDFNVTVTELINGDMYRESSFEEIVKLLDNMYISKNRKDIQSISRDIKNTNLIEDETLNVQLVPVFGNFNSISSHFLSDEKINLVSKFPTKGNNETIANFNKRRDKFLRDLMNNLLFFTHIGPQLTDEVQKKVFSVEFMTTENLLNKITDIVRNLPDEKRALIKTKSEKCNASSETFAVNEVDVERNSVNNDDSEIYYAKDSYKRGVNRDYKNMRSFRYRGSSNAYTRGNRANYVDYSRGDNKHNFDDRHKMNQYKCFECGKNGHIAKHCRERKPCGRCGLRNHHVFDCEASIETVRRFKHKKAQEVNMVDEQNFLE